MLVVVSGLFTIETDANNTIALVVLGGPLMLHADSFSVQSLSRLDAIVLPAQIAVRLVGHGTVAIARVQQSGP